jgi:hypothetical protein
VVLTTEKKVDKNKMSPIYLQLLTDSRKHPWLEPFKMYAVEDPTMTTISKKNPAPLHRSGHCTKASRLGMLWHLHERVDDI